MIRCWSIICLAILAAGCMLGPDYKRPQGAVEERPEAQAPLFDPESALFSSDAPPDAWWRLYQDETLDELIADAVTANTDLRMASANIARANSGVDLAEDARWPQWGIEALYNFERLSAEEELEPKQLPNFRVYGVELGVSYEVDLFGKIKRTLQSRQATLAAAKATYDAVRIAVVAQTTLAYVNACSAGRELVVANQLVDLQKKNTDLVDRMYRQGRGISLDSTRSSTQEEQVRATLPSLLAEKQLALYRLAALSGKPPSALPSELGECVQEPMIKQVIPIGDGVQFLKRRPDIREAEEDLRAATANMGVAESSLYPEISLGADVGSIGLTKHTFRPDTYTFSMGPLIKWSIPNPKRAHAVVKGAQAQVDVAFARFDGVVLNALQEVESDLTVYARELDRHAALAQANQHAQNAAMDSETLFLRGRSSYLTVLDADRTRISTEQALAASETRLSSDRVLVFLALGGGWQASEPVKPVVEGESSK